LTFIALAPAAPLVLGVLGDVLGLPGVPADGAPDRTCTLVNTNPEPAAPLVLGVVAPPEVLSAERQPLRVTVCPIMPFRLVSCRGVSWDGRVVCGVVLGVCGAGDGFCAITAPANVTLNASVAAFRNAFSFISSPY
jgi:hypothetical protein